MAIVTDEQLQDAIATRQKISAEVLEITVWEAREERYIKETAKLKRDPLLKRMRALQDDINDYRRAKRRQRSDQ